MKMKARDVVIKVESLHDGLVHFAETYKKISRREKVEPEEMLTFETEELMRQTLTKERLRILRVIREKEPETIYALAKLLQRPYANVFKDVKKLAELELIDLGKEKGGTRPKAKYDRLNISIPV